MVWIAWFAAAATLVYVSICALMFATQRNIIYRPADRHVSIADAGLSGLVTEQTYKTADGETLTLWLGDARPGLPTILYFHGNAGNLAERRDRIEAWRSAGLGFLIASHRGYPGSTGRPTEEKLYADALALYDKLVAGGTEPKSIVLFGESLGTGIASKLAVERKVAGVVLDAPYTSIADIGRRAYPWLPVGWLLLDHYDTLSRIDRINAPLLILQGALDRIVPLDMAQQVFARAKEPKRMEVFAEAGHIFHGQFGSLRLVKEFAVSVGSGN